MRTKGIPCTLLPGMQASPDTEETIVEVLHKTRPKIYRTTQLCDSGTYPTDSKSHLTDVHTSEHRSSSHLALGTQEKEIVFS